MLVVLIAALFYLAGTGLFMWARKQGRRALFTAAEKVMVAVVAAEIAAIAAEIATIGFPSGLGRTRTMMCWPGSAGVSSSIVPSMATTVTATPTDPTKAGWPTLFAVHGGPAAGSAVSR